MYKKLSAVYMDPVVSTALGTVLGAAAGYYWRSKSGCSDTIQATVSPDVQRENSGDALTWNIGSDHPALVDSSDRNSFSHWNFAEFGDFATAVVDGYGHEVRLGGERKAGSNLEFGNVGDDAPYLKCDAPLIQNGALATQLNCKVGYDQATEQNRTCFVESGSKTSYTEENGIIRLSNITIKCPSGDALLPPIG